MKITKKQILALGSALPLGFVLGMALKIISTSIDTELEKYNVAPFSIIDSLKIDTIFRKRGELYTDTLIDYYGLSEKEISLKTSHVYLKPEGFLSVKNKEIFRYKLLKNGVLSEEILGKNNEIKDYSIIGDFIGGGFKLNKLRLMRYGTTSNFLDDTFNINNSYQKDTNQGIYTRNTDLGKKVLENEQAEVKKYLNKIAEYKKSLKD